MGLFYFISLTILCVAILAWSGSTALSVLLFIGAVILLTPAGSPEKQSQKGCGSLWGIAIGLLGLTWLMGGDDD
jgi:hypothetical protein